jgi:hypothetical protein
MFEVMVAGIDGLVIMKSAGETLDCPAENLWNQQSIAPREHREVNGLHFHFDGRRIIRRHGSMHAEID